MKHTIFQFATIILATMAGASPRALREHVDVHWAYDEVDGWTCLAKTKPGGGVLFEELEEVYLPIDDAPVGSGGLREIQPEDGTYAFTGVAPGDPIWIAPQDQLANLCWPGFNNDQATGVFESYQETDTRLSDDDRNQAQPWIKVTLTGVTYQGGGAGSFSMWRQDLAGMPTVWFSTSDNTHPDTFFTRAGDHVHLFWGFGSPGIYRIRLSASAFLAGPEQPNPTGPSPEFTVTYAVGKFAQWQAENFSGSQLDDVNVSGSSADPDNDGIRNLLEYAFGTDPLHGASVPLADGLGLPLFSLVEDGGTIYQTLTYPRRKAGSRVDPEIYQPLFADSPAGPWSDSGVTTTAAAFPPAQAALNADWELVTSRRPAPPGKIAGFGRVAVTPGD
jgi:hypothetical protein